jgi:hypothetical protein
MVVTPSITGATAMPDKIKSERHHRPHPTTPTLIPPTNPTPIAPTNPIQPTNPTPIPPTNPTPIAPTTTATTHYGTSPPAKAPVGWQVGHYEDFNSWNIGGNDASGNPFATTNDHPTSQWQLAPIPNCYCIQRHSEQEFFCSPQATPGINPFSHSGSILTITASVNNGIEASLPKGQLASYLPNVFKSYVNEGMQNPPFASGAINTSNFLKAKYGYFELNCKQPSGTGMWNAFWMHPNPSEFDIFETVGGQNNKLGFTAHYNPGNGMIGNSSNNFNPDLGVDTTTSFHTYGGLWTPNYLAWYFDGNLVFKAPMTLNGIGGFTANPTYLIISFSLGTGMGSQRTPASLLPKSLEIDWFRYSLLGPQ